ncbi:MAG: hypothetical protein RI897_710 [Verrucomicrobiota bacterium]|jgi:hypothetical protein
MGQHKRHAKGHIGTPGSSFDQRNRKLQGHARYQQVLRNIVGLTLICPSLAIAAPANWQQHDGFQSAAVAPSGNGKDGFELLSPTHTGLHFTNQLALERYITNQIYLNGAGVALGDADGDGLCDVYLCSIDTANALFRNLGDWKFEDITDDSRAALNHLASSGAAFADLDGDGDLDLIVNSVGQGTHLLLNDGKAHFSPAPSSPVNPGKAGMTSALADTDGDGDLDLYLTNYRTETIRDRPQAKINGRTVDGKPVIVSYEGRPTTDPDLVGRFTIAPSGRIIEHGEADLLLRNNSAGHFTPVPFTGGTFLNSEGLPLSEPPYDWGLSAMFRDLNHDGSPDLYVANDFDSPDQLWMNDGTGRFRQAPKLALRHTSIFSMGVDFGDLNRDGHDDIIVSDMMMQTHAGKQLRIGDVPPVVLEIGVIEDRPQYSANTLQLNRGDGTFAEVAHFAHAEASGWTWCPVLLDIDLDGYEDVIFPTGHERDMMNADVIEEAEAAKSAGNLTRLEQLYLRARFDRFDTPNVAFRNRGNLQFEDFSDRWGFTAGEVSQGIALGDLDNDGDLDVVVNNLNGPASIYRNGSSAPRIAVCLKGLAPNTRGIGARIQVDGGPVKQQSQEITAGGRYLSSDEALRVFAATRSQNAPHKIQVLWPSGRTSVVHNATANHIYLVEEPATQPSTAEPSPPTHTWFEEITAFQHTHTETAFDDFIRQPLLPRKLSQPGPGIAWADLDKDGWDDLIIGTGAGGHLGAFRNQNGTALKPFDLPFVQRTLNRDLAGITVSGGVVLAASSNYEDGSNQGGWLRIYDFNRQATGESVMSQAGSAGPVAMADVNNDGMLDLFIGGRCIPGRYPEPADSILLVNQAGRLKVTQTFAKLGLVSGATFSDLDNDGDPDLILAQEWGPIRIFLNEQGTFQDATEQVGLAGLHGLWNGIATADLNNDGRPDLIAGNWGRNSSYTASAKGPRRLYYKDFDGDDVIDIVEAYVDSGTGRELPGRGLKPLSLALPWLKDQIGNYQSYGMATLQEIYGDMLDDAPMLEIHSLESMVFINRGGKFEPAPLPPEAQLAPAMGICVADFDGDGHQDVFLSQNFFAVAMDRMRQDAGRGLWLQGDGQGNLQPIPGQESGIAVYGEQRGCAVSDYDQDGRVDLVVTQNGAATRLFRNVKANPGLRVQLSGSPGNPAVIGAAMRLLYTNNRTGPTCEIQAGSGYSSQNSSTLVLGHQEPPTHLQIRWPGGKLLTTPIKPGTRQIRVDITGTIESAP